MGSQGKPTFIRAIGPANANAATDPLLTYFPIFNAYIASAFNPTTGAPVTPINISNSYSGVAPKPATTVCTGNGGAAFKAQSYSTSAIKFLGNKLTITGTGSTVGDFTISAMTPIVHDARRLRESDRTGEMLQPGGDAGRFLRRPLHRRALLFGRAAATMSARQARWRAMAPMTCSRWWCAICW